MRTRQGRRLIVALFLGMLAAVLVLPFSGHLLDGSSAYAVETEESGAVESGSVEFEGANPRSDTWREARRGLSGTTTDEGIERGVLIQTEGEIWQELRNNTVITVMAWIMGLALLAVIAFHLIFGRARLQERTGRVILRWPAFDRIVHWWVAITFILLAITGLALLYGRGVLIPVMGKEAFAAFAAVCKPVHNYTAALFTVGLVIMLLMWLPENFLKSHDITWFKQGGGYIDKDKHPPAGFVNAGEKVWFWLLFVGGITVIVSGFYMLFPNFEFGRQTIQIANVIHSVSGLGLTAVLFGHIYLGTLGNEGTFQSMVNGHVDEGWAKQHHRLWYDEVVRGVNRKDTAKPPKKTLQQPT